MFLVGFGKFLPHLPTQTMRSITDSSRAFLWAIFMLVSAMAASYFQIHVFLQELVDIAFPLVLICGMLGGLLIVSWCCIHIFSVLPTRRPQLISIGTQTHDDVVSLSLIYASRGGKCFHIPDKCVYNGGVQDIQVLRRCRNCG